MTQTTNSPIVAEFLAKPSRVAPTLFVGLGGSGCQIINRVYTQLARRPDFQERFKDLSKFAYVDTNIHDLERYREFGDDIFLISDFEKAEYSRLAGGKAYLDPDDYFTQWVPENYRFRSGDTAGAGQIRIESRLGVYYQIKHKDFVARFRRLFEELLDHAHGHRRLDSSEIRIIIAYSVAGGTGSGSNLPIAYLLRDIAEQFGKPLIFGVAALSSVFEDKVGVNKDGTFANGYAALKETEYLMKLGAPESRFFPEDGKRVFHYNPADRSRRTVNQKPFEVLWIIDRPESFAVDSVLAAAGDAVFLQLYTPIYSHQAGDFDNYTQHQRFLVPYDFEAKNIPGYTSFYGALGAAVLHVPDRTLLQYCARRGGLAVIENSFLQGKPPGEVYIPIGEEFFEIESEDGRGRVIKEMAFDRRPAPDRRKLRNRLFQKRVRLLALAEMEADGEEEFFSRVFRHGHGPRCVPEKDGGVKVPDLSLKSTAPSKLDENLIRFKEQFSDEAEKLARSMGHFVLNALEAPPAKPGAAIKRNSPTGVWTSKLYLEAKKAVEESLIRDCEAWATEREEEKRDNKSIKSAIGLEKDKVFVTTPRSELEEVVRSFETRAVATKLGRLLDRPDASSPVGVDWMPGFDWLGQLRFLSAPEAQATNLVERRYAVLTVLDRVNAMVEDCNKEKKDRAESAEKAAAGEKAERDGTQTDGAAPGKEELIDHQEIRNRARDAIEQACRRVEMELFKLYSERLVSFQTKLSHFADVFTDLQQQYAALSAHEIAEAEKLRVVGSKDETDAFVLDGEALQIESGRRMWDFYFEDEISRLEALYISTNPQLAKTIATTIDRLVATRERQEGTPGDALNKLYVDVSADIAEALRHTIVGELRSSTEADRHGLTLDQALRLELKYRAIYLTNREPVDKGVPGAIATLVAAARGMREPLDPHMDYLRDKFKRLIKERSNLLCYLDEKHLSQGGVRPDEVFLAAVHDDLYSGLLKNILNESLGLTPPKVITDDVEDRKMVVFYRAVLNVPLYVFGRLRELRACYHQFKGLAKRPKVLHIDKNWEETLPDLDPASVEEAHKQERIRESVLDFATLLSVPLTLIFDSFVSEEDRKEIKFDPDRLVDEKWVGEGEAGSPSMEKSYGVARADTCIYWREEAGQSGGHMWVIRTPLEERIRRMELDGSDPDELSGEEPVIGNSLGEAVLRAQEILNASPELYRFYRETCTMVRDGKVPRVIQSLIRLPGDWRKHREGLRTRYGRSPTEEQQRALDDLKNVEDKLTDALAQLHDKLDLRRREAAMRVEAVLSGKTESSRKSASKEFEQSITLLYDFKNSLRGAPTVLTRKGRAVQLFSALDPEELKTRLRR